MLRMKDFQQNCAGEFRRKGLILCSRILYVRLEFPRSDSETCFNQVLFIRRKDKNFLCYILERCPRKSTCVQMIISPEEYLLNIQYFQI